MIQRFDENGDYISRRNARSSVASPRGMASACGASSPGFDSRNIQMFFLLLGTRWLKRKLVTIKLYDLASPSIEKINSKPPIGKHSVSLRYGNQ